MNDHAYPYRPWSFDPTISGDGTGSGMLTRAAGKVAGASLDFLS